MALLMLPMEWEAKGNREGWILEQGCNGCGVPEGEYGAQQDWGGGRRSSESLIHKGKRPR